MEELAGAGIGSGGLSLRKYAIPALLAIALAAGVFFWRQRRELTVAELLDRFPAGEGVTAWIDVAALRAAGVVDLIAGYKPVQDPEYSAFVKQSGFDYTKDLDAVLLTVRGDNVYMLLKGRFPQKSLEAYVNSSSGGACSSDLCRMTGSRPDRKISFTVIRHGIMALAVGPDESAVTTLLNEKKLNRTTASTQPVWISVPPAALRKNSSGVAGTRAFASALSKAETVTLSLGAEGERFVALLDVISPTPGDAAFLLLQLQEATELLKNLIAREKKQPNRSDLSGVLTAGTFGRDDRRVWGKWPIERSFLQALTEGTP